MDVDAKILRKTFWGDIYFDAKKRKFYKNAISKLKKPCFVQFILENIWKVYESFDCDALHSDTDVGINLRFYLVYLIEFS